MAKVGQARKGLCGFCGKARREVAHLIAGLGNARICSECIELTIEVLAEEHEIPTHMVYDRLKERREAQQAEHARRHPT